MKLSLWKEYSSNNSTRFIIVGQFETQAWAEQVHMEVQSIVRDISEWWLQIPALDRPRISNELDQEGRLTPPERLAQQRYQINFWSLLDALDWVRYEEAHERVTRFGTLVCIAPYETWGNQHPFDEILRKLGGQVAVEIDSGDTIIVLNLRMIAPDETAAQSLSAYLVPAHNGKRILVTFPGLPHFVGTIRSDGIHVFIDEMRVRATYDLVQPRTNPTKVFEVDFVDMLQHLLIFLKVQGMTSIEYQITQIAR